MNRTMTTALAALAVLGAGATARAQSRGGEVGVRDGAGMFSAAAVKEADETLREVRRQTHWSVLVETVESLEGGKPVKETAIANAKALKEHGLYLLISRRDHQFYAEPSQLAEKAFSHETIRRIKDAILSDFKASKFDKGLLDAVAQIRRAAEAAPDTAVGATPPVRAARSDELPRESEPTPARNPAPVPNRGGETGSMLPTLLLGGGAVVVVLWLLSRAFRRAPSYPPQPQSSAQDASPGYRPGQAGPGYASAPGPRPAPGYAPQQTPPGYAPQRGMGYGPPPAPGYGPPQQAGGGGFMSGLLGGAAGAMAGNILYDKFGRPHEGQGVPPHIPGGGGGVHHEASTWPQEPMNVDPNGPPPEGYNPNAGDGGDWGGAVPPPEPNADAGGDWGTPEPASAAETDAGAGDWGTPEPDNSGAGGGDWGAPEPDDSGAGGGDWGSDSPAPDDDQGGSW